MKVQRGFEGGCTRATGPQKKEQLPAAAIVCSDMKDIQETIRKRTANEPKGYSCSLMLLFNTERDNLNKSGCKDSDLEVVWKKIISFNK